MALALFALVGCGDDDTGVAASDDDQGVDDPTPGAGDEGPQLGDHWHVAVGFSRCGEELSILEDAVPDETGIHSHADGLIHVHPFTTEAAGDNAVLGRFFETVGAEVTDEGLVTDEWTLPFEGECDGEPATLMLATWPTYDAEGSIAFQTRLGSAEQLRSVPLSPDGSAIAIALATEDEEIALPPSATELEAPSDVAASTTLPSASGQGTRADVDFGLAPVLGASEPPCGPSATLGARDEQCYELGPIALGREAIASAERRYESNGWTVFVTLTTAGDEAFDRVAMNCFDRSAECPSGMLAIVLDGGVISAPTVQEPTFQGEFVISGDFTEEEAGEIAESLSP